LPIVNAPEQFNQEDLYLDLHSTMDLPVHLKCEGFNFAGSIKLKAATEMVDAAERQGLLSSDSILIESSSGNLGVALSMIAANRGYAFECVTDARCNLATRLLMEAMGSQVKVITEGDPERGLLGARLDYVRERCETDPRYVWLNQHANPNNWKAHYRVTAPAIARRFPKLDVLFIGADTTGTLMGCARYFRQTHPGVTIVAVDSVGSVTFGVPAGLRMIGGHPLDGASAMLDAAERDRAGRLLRDGDRHRYLASHVGLRVLLGGYLGLSPEKVTLVREDCPCCGGPHGRPAVAEGAVHFSLSHSEDVAYFAFAEVPVGVDVEGIPSAAEVADVLAGLHPAETAELTALPEPDRRTALARVWSRKEAYLKATGTGLALGVADPYVGSAPAPARVPGWILTDLPAPTGYAAALALRG